MWKTVLFDLDGTLTDSAEGITRCVQYALEHMGKTVPDIEDLYCFVGPPLKEQFMEYAGFSEEEGKQAVTYYRERYEKEGIYENRLYPRIIPLLELLKKNGFAMAVTSSKPEIYVRKILETFSIDEYFTAVVGSEMDGHRTDKTEVLQEALRRLNLENKKEQVVLIGDRKYDIQGAKAVGIDCIAVGYGYGSIEELEAEDPFYVAEHISDVAECILQAKAKQEKQGPIFKTWRILYPIGIHFLASLLATAAGSLIIVLYQSFVLHNTDIGQLESALMFWNTVFIGVGNLIAMPIVLWLYRKDQWKRRDSGIRSLMMIPEKFTFVQMIGVALFFMILSNFLNVLISLSGIVNLSPTYQQLEQSIFEAPPLVIQIVVIGILAPIVEELVFRGLVYHRFRDYTNVSVACIASALLFGLYHGNLVQFVFATLVGIALVLVFERYKTLWAPILGHVAVNLPSVLQSAMQRNQSGGGQSLSMQVMIIYLLGEAVLLAVMATLVLKKPKKVQ